MSIVQETATALAEAELPDPPGLFQYEGLQVHRTGGSLLVFGHVPFAQMIEIAKRYGEIEGTSLEVADAEAYDVEHAELADLGDMVDNVLAHLAYDHVSYEPPTEDEPGEIIVERGEGLIPVTLWEL